MKIKYISHVRSIPKGAKNIYDFLVEDESEIKLKDKNLVFYNFVKLDLLNRLKKGEHKLQLFVDDEGNKYGELSEYISFFGKEINIGNVSIENTGNDIEVHMSVPNINKSYKYKNPHKSIKQENHFYLLNVLKQNEINNSYFNNIVEDNGYKSKEFAEIIANMTFVEHGGKTYFKLYRSLDNIISFRPFFQYYSYGNADIVKTENLNKEIFEYNIKRLFLKIFNKNDFSHKNKYEIDPNELLFDYKLIKFLKESHIIQDPKENESAKAEKYLGSDVLHTDHYEFHITKLTKEDIKMFFDFYEYSKKNSDILHKRFDYNDRDYIDGFMIDYYEKNYENNNDLKLGLKW